MLCVPVLELVNRSWSKRGRGGVAGIVYFLRDLVPLHFHFLRDRRSGELGVFAALGCFFIWPAERAQ